MNWQDRVIKHLRDPLLDPYRDRLIFIGAQGSQNHATLAMPNSDMDTVALVLPAANDIVTLDTSNYATCLVRDNNEHIKVYDIRYWINLLYKQNMNDVELLFTDYYMPLTRSTGSTWEDLLSMREQIARYNPGRTVRTTIGHMDSCIKRAKANRNNYELVFKQYKNCYFLDCFIGAYIAGYNYKDCLTFCNGADFEGYRSLSVEDFIKCMELYKENSEDRYQKNYIGKLGNENDENVRQKLTDWTIQLLKENIE